MQYKILIIIITVVLFLRIMSLMVKIIRNHMLLNTLYEIKEDILQENNSKKDKDNIDEK